MRHKKGVWEIYRRHQLRTLIKVQVKQKALNTFNKTEQNQLGQVFEVMI